MKPHSNSSLRLNKYVAQHLAVGRRHVDELIEDGAVLVNGTRAILGARIDPAVDTVIVNGTALTAADESAFVYLALDKPIGYVCSRRAQGDSPTIYDLLPQQYHHLKSVGRLDKDSSGLLLLTNDGDFAHRLTHPSFAKHKAYEVTLDQPLAPLYQQMINDHGIALEDGVSQLTLEKMTDDARQWRITMHEGRNRQIRRTFASLGYIVTKLHRTQFGIYSLDNLKEGTFEVLAI